MSFSDPAFLDRFGDTVSYRLGSLFYKRYIRSLGLRGNERLLDFGCGSGGSARYLAMELSRGGRITCYDRYGFWVERAERRLRRHGNIDFLAGEPGVLAEGDSFTPRFDAILVHFVLHEIEPGIRRNTADLLSRLLIPGGSLFIRETAKARHGIPPEEIRAVFKAAGLSEQGGTTTKKAILGPVYSGRYTNTPTPVDKAGSEGLSGTYPLKNAKKSKRP
jgi:ubiquinone/menaquinone biosynthesis C-methylase UbiE